MVRPAEVDAFTAVPGDVLRRIAEPVLEALAERISWVPVVFVPAWSSAAFGIGCVEADMTLAQAVAADGRGIGEPALVATDRWVRTFPITDRDSDELFGHVVVLGRMSGSAIPAVSRILGLLSDTLVGERRSRLQQDRLRQIEAQSCELRSRAAGLESAGQFHDELHRQVAAGGWGSGEEHSDSLHQIVGCLSRHFGVPVVLQGRNLLTLAESGTCAAAAALIPGRHQSPRDIVGPLGRADGVVELPPTSAGPGRLVAPIRGGGELLGFLTLVPGEADSAAVRQALECATGFIALERLIRGEIEEAQQFDREGLLRDLFTGNSLHRLLHRGLRMDIDLRCAFYPCVFVAPRVGPTSPAQLRTVVLEAIREVIPRGSEAFGAILDDAFICLVPADVVDDARTICERVVLRGKDQSLQVRAGIGPLCSDLDDYEPAVRKARWVTEVLEAIGGQECATFDDLGIYAILFDRDHSTQLDEFVERRLGALISYDRLHKTDLAETLRCVLDTGGVMTEAAKQLFIHISTLKYRVNRIEELLGVELRDPQTAFNLHLACKILGVRRHLGRVPEEPSDQEEDPPAEIGAARRRAALLAPVADEDPPAEESRQRPAGGARR